MTKNRVEGREADRHHRGCPPLRFKDLPGFLQAYKEPDFMFDFVTFPFTRLEEAHCMLMNTFEAMEGEPLEILREQMMPGCRFYTVGPVLPADYFSGGNLSKSSDFNKAPGFWAEDYSCLKWLDGQQDGSVLYVSFGSIALLTEEELHEFALGLEATGFPVLWVLRLGVLEGGGHTSLPPGFEEHIQGRVHIIDWAPQLHVLAHPSVGAFFTHGGWNSTLEGISQGKPLLGFQYFADQMLNCRCIQDLWGNGLALERHGEGLLTRSLVESNARTVMSNPKLRETAVVLRDGARLAILSREQGSSSWDLRRFVESWTLRKRDGSLFNNYENEMLLAGQRKKLSESTLKASKLSLSLSILSIHLLKAGGVSNSSDCMATWRNLATLEARHV
ncbi:hypothetical protein L7F22_052197 [Adiantum nelumboides]|nr:hypothetical protein [Adiantum nelumboides]